MDTTQPTEAHDLSPLRLRVGVSFIVVWFLPFWALGPWIADVLNGSGNSPTGAEVTTVIAVVQTLIGLAGFWIAGKEATVIVKNSTKREAAGAIWSMLIHGAVRDPDPGQARPPSGK